MAELRSPLPPHLARYVVAQDYGAYTPRDHAVWRHILRRLTAHLQDRAHPSYLEGLAAAGIGVERIPSLEEMNARLAQLGWRRGGGAGLHPPGGVHGTAGAGASWPSPRTSARHEHIDYTPAPDIVHESAGHAPILKDPRYADYLKRCGVAGFKAIASRRGPGGLRSHPQPQRGEGGSRRHPEDGRLAQARLEAAQASRTYVSESTKASRLYWWTAEYGLVGSLDAPRIYGAGPAQLPGRGRPLPHRRGGEGAPVPGLRGPGFRHHPHAAPAVRGPGLRPPVRGARGVRGHPGLEAGRRLTAWRRPCGPAR